MWGEKGLPELADAWRSLTLAPAINATDRNLTFPTQAVSDETKYQVPKE